MRSFIKLKRLVASTAPRFQKSFSQDELATARTDAPDASGPLPSGLCHDGASQSTLQEPLVLNTIVHLSAPQLFSRKSKPTSLGTFPATIELDIPEPAQHPLTSMFEARLYEERDTLRYREDTIVTTSYGKFEWIFTYEAFVGWATGSTPLL
jgi:hypothetical protein